VKVADVAGPLTVDSRNGRVDASDIRGPATITCSFGTVQAKNIGGPARITNQNGNVTATDIRGDLTVDDRFGTVRAERINGSIDVDNANGAVNANDIAGSAKVRSSFGPVFIKGVTGSVEVENGNGAISVTGLRGSGCQTLSLRTSFSSIKVGVGASANYAVNASTSFGSINAALPIATKHSSDETLIGTLGNGSCRMDLSNANGNISIGREWAGAHARRLRGVSCFQRVAVENWTLAK
jgi:DUF4097 and DUF4098 domain-containing protein YvlB